MSTCSPAWTSMPVSIQDSSPVSWTSWDRRFFPCCVCSEAGFCDSCFAGGCCCVGAVFSRTSCRCKTLGRTVARKMSPARRDGFFIEGRFRGAAIPRRVSKHLHCKQMRGEGASVVPGGRRNPGVENRFYAGTAKRGEKRRDSLTECVEGL